MKKILKFKKLFIVLGIIIAAIIVLVMVGKNFIQKAAESSEDVALQMVEKRDLSEYVTLSGSVTGVSQQNYASSAGSEITAINVSVGDEVKAGDVIATLDSASIQSQIDVLQKSISNAQAVSDNQAKQNQQAVNTARADQKDQLASAQLSIDQARNSYNNAVSSYNDLYDQWESKKAELDQAQATLDATDPASEEYPTVVESYNALAAEVQTLVEQVNAAAETQNGAALSITEAENSYNSTKRSTDAAIQSAQNTVDMQQYTDSSDTETINQLDGLKKQLEDCTIKATSDGIVTAVNVKVGDTNTPGSALVTVENDREMMMNASVSENDILKIQEGMTAEVTVAALGETPIEGEIVRVVRVSGNTAAAPTGSGDGAATSSSGSGAYSVQIKLAPSDVISGMSAKALITLKEKKDVLGVPYDLVQTDENGASYVLCAQDEGEGLYTAVRKNITTGEELDYYVEVIGGDLSEGDLLIMNYDIAEGQKFNASIDSSDMSGMGEDTTATDGSEATTEGE